jgi:pyruvate carboxylase
MAAPQQPLTFNDVFEEDDIDEPKEANSVHHIRANSSIMHVKKILGECWRAPYSHQWLI